MVVSGADPCHNTNDTDGHNDWDSRAPPRVEDDNSDGLRTDGDTERAEEEIVFRV